MSINSLSLKSLKLGTKNLLINTANGRWAFVDDEVIHALQSNKFAPDLYQACIKLLTKYGIIDVSKSMSSEEKYISLLTGNMLKLIILKVTSLCNLRCRYCYYYPLPYLSSSSSGGWEYLQPTLSDQKMSYTIAEMTINLLEDYVSTMMSKTKSLSIVLEFHGGEPLLAADVILHIIKLVRRSKNLRHVVHFAIQTNGTIATDEALMALKNIGSAGISLDGPPEINDMCRIFPDGTGSYDVIAENIEEYRRHGIQVGLLAVYHKGSEGKILRIVEHFVEDLNIRSFRINPLIRQGRALHRMVPNIDAFCKDIIKLIDWLIERNKEIDKADEMIFEANIAHAVEKILGLKPGDVCEHIPCGAGTEMINIAPNGVVYACDHLPGSKLGTVQNLRSIFDLFNTWQRDFLSVFLAAANNNCSSCPFWSICNGGCRGWYLSENKDITSKSRFACRYHYTMIKHIFEKIAEDFMNAYYLSGINVEKIIEGRYKA